MEELFWSGLALHDLLLSQDMAIFGGIWIFFFFSKPNNLISMCPNLYFSPPACICNEQLFDLSHF